MCLSRKQEVVPGNKPSDCVPRQQRRCTLLHVSRRVQKTCFVRPSVRRKQRRSEMMNNPLNESLFREESFEMQILVTQSCKKVFISFKYLNVRSASHPLRTWCPNVGGAKASGQLREPRPPECQRSLWAPQVSVSALLGVHQLIKQTLFEEPTGWGLRKHQVDSINQLPCLNSTVCKMCRGPQGDCAELYHTAAVH